ncbi:MAG: hypothetical protein AAGD38_24495 [Acidobacteriota bacterium]
MIGERHSIENWLHAEATGDELEAERSLARLMEALPRPTPSPGFTDRVMAVATVPRVEPIGWPVGLAFAACLFAVAIAAPLLPTFFAIVIEVTESIFATTRAMTVVAETGGVLAFGQWLLRLISLLLDVLTTAPVVTAVAFAAMVATLAIRGLNRLLAPRRLHHALDASLSR